MHIGFPSTPTLNGMERYLDLLARKQDLVVSNLANIDTPGFKTWDLAVEAAMRETTDQGPGVVLRRHGPRHLARLPFGNLPAYAYEPEGLPQRNDYNNVDLDREMLNLSKTTMKFSLFAQLLRGEFRQLQHAISEGK